MRTAVICFSDSGADIAKKLCGALDIDLRDVHSTVKFASKYGFSAHETVSADMGIIFTQYDALIFVCACGIAVREIAPYIKDKATDPAVLVMDDRGKFVIPVLSGHIGGANRLAETVGELTGALSVITTATDGARRFSCDKWATEHGCAISSLELAKEISAAVLTGDVCAASEYELPERLPAGLAAGETGELGIYIGIHVNEPFRRTLRLIPRIVTLGIGCRRGTAEEDISAAVSQVLEKNKIDARAVSRIASIDVKRDEEGLVSFAKKLGVPAVFYSAQELCEVPGEFAESEFVRQTVGVGNVCERAAAAAGGRLIVKKTALNGVTVAAAIDDWGVTF